MKIGRNDPCPCGSGKKHKNCCGATASRPSTRPPENEDRQWMEAHVAPDGDMLLYGLIQTEMESIPAAEFWKKLRIVAENYLESGQERTRIFHELVDQTIEQLTARDQRLGYAAPYCHKGCCDCCHEPVYCTDDEATEIQEYCQAQGLVIDYAKLSRQLDYVEFDHLGNHTGGSTWNDQDKADQSCIFLDPLDRACRIWPVRPFVCRMHLAEGSNQYCAPHNGAENPNARGINYIELSYILSAIFTIHRDSIRKTLGKLLLATKPAAG